MKKILFIFLATICIGSSFADVNPAYTQIINSMAEQLMQNNQTPGLALVIFHQGKPLFFTYGVANQTTRQPVTQQTIFEIGSLTKTFTATLLAMQVQAGKIKLNAAVGPYLPKELQVGQEVINQVTFEQLATHTASLPKVPPDFEPDEAYDSARFFDFLIHWQPSYPLGSKWHYSNIGFGVLSYALAGAVKQDFWNYLQNDLLKPLAMNQTTYFVPAIEESQYAQGYFADNEPAPRWMMMAWKPGSGALRSTPNDMMKFLQANLNVGDAPIAIRQAMQFAQQSYFKINDRTMQGLAWATTTFPNGQKIVWKDGATAGFSTFIALAPDKHAGLVIMINKKTKSKELMKFAKIVLNGVQ